jgi:thiosulfate/3-mercaptopyruvate sulfurtransferase
MRYSLAFAAALGFAAAPMGAQTPDPSMVVSTTWLASHLNDPDLVVVSLQHSRDDYDEGHIPGARYAAFDGLTRTVNGVTFEMLEADSLSGYLRALGIDRNSHVVVESEMLPMATRMLATLVYAGVPHVSLLNGGAPQWVAEHRPMTKAAPTFEPSRFVATIDPFVVSADWVRDHLRAPRISLVDTRPDPEYLGGGERHGQSSRGHVPGARQLQWETMTSDMDNMTLKPIGDLQHMFAQRVAPGDTVVTYCAIGYRASATWFVAKYLGYPARFFDGSYQEWSRRGFPTDTARVALRKE